ACFSLLDNDTVIASPEVSVNFPNGEIEFLEDSFPPSRAYLKLWEFFTVYRVRPTAGERCIDLGACPGGWTWVLSELGCKVISVDKAPLDAKLLKRKNIEVKKHDAFTLKPEDVGPVDWLFSDVICEPKRLLELVHQWRSADMAKNFVCTIKFKGKTDHAIIREFLKLEGSRARHLYVNKHEITWWLTSSR
ncbi:MAG TPA: SAM-dependent methyltransferase, partial [Bdellovibrionales bacterium]|nr:SAM-dependent methyltransferase [Bdellovibrionales bacterium]